MKGTVPSGKLADTINQKRRGKEFSGELRGLSLVIR